jgi:hypothetical protein
MVASRDDAVTEDNEEYKEEETSETSDLANARLGLGMLVFTKQRERG